jgi:hypothetical protein
MLTIAINPFARRQTPESRFGHTTLSDEALVTLVSEHFPWAHQGYRPGVLVVPVPSEGFYSSTVPLQPGMALSATYKARRPGEAPRLHVGYQVPEGGYQGAKAPAVAVDVILYQSAVLAEGGDNSLEPDPDNWEIVSINPRMSQEEEPIHPNTLMANHFQESGGTATGMTDSEFVAALRKSRAYWNQHVQPA